MSGYSNDKGIQKGDKVRDQYRVVSKVLGVWDNVVTTTAGVYHITKVWKAEN